MEFLIDLWLPIIASAVAVFLVSSVIHMCTPMHKSDYAHLPNEEIVLEKIRECGVPPGMYMFPGAESMKDMGNPEYKSKCERGPVGYMILLPNTLWQMSKSLTHWFLYSVLISLLTAYVAGFTINVSHDFSDILRLTGTVSTMGYAMASPPDSIWKGVNWGVSGRFIVDGILYGITTGLVFAWLWPSAL